MPGNALMRYTIYVPDDSLTPGGNAEEMALNGSDQSAVKNGGSRGIRTGSLVRRDGSALSYGGEMSGSGSGVAAHRAGASAAAYPARTGGIPLAGSSTGLPRVYPHARKGIIGASGFRERFNDEAAVPARAGYLLDPRLDGLEVGSIPTRAGKPRRL